MAIKRRKRGISAGTIIMLSVCVVTLLAGAGIFLRVSGDLGEMQLDPKLLTEPLSQLARQSVDADALLDHPEGLSAPPEGGTAAAPTVAPTPEPTPPPSRTLTIAAVGQVATGTELRNSALSGGSYSFSSILTPVGAALSGADLSIATLRTGLTEDSGAFDGYNAPPAIATSLHGAGVNLVNLATDRLFDHGAAGMQGTLRLLSGMGLASAGAYAGEAERQALTIADIGGVRVGVLSYTTSVSSAGQKAATSAEINAGTRLYTSGQAAAADVAALRSQGAEVVLVLAHWGSRGDQNPSREVREMADALANAGADIILGTGPTMVQSFERRTATGPDGITREVFIAYSLGNFLIDDSRETGDITGVALRLTLQWDAQSQRATFTECTYMPTWIMRWKDGGGTNRYRIVPAGMETMPENMTDSIYINMKKAYQSMISRLGSDAARPVQGP